MNKNVIFMKENKLFTQEQKKMILDTPLTVECFDTPINDKDNEFFHYVNQEWENLLNTLNRIRTMAKETGDDYVLEGFMSMLPMSYIERLRETERKRNGIEIMDDKDFPLEMYVQEKKLNQNDYEVICSALKENKNILVGTKDDDERKKLMNAIIKKMIEFEPDKSLCILEKKFPVKCKYSNLYIKINPDASITKAIAHSIRFGTNTITLQKPTIICDTLNGDIEGTYELIKAWDFRITAGGVVGLNADSLENMTQVIVEDVLLNIKEKQLEHNFQGLNGKVDLCIYFDGNTISVSSING